MNGNGQRINADKALAEIEKLIEGLRLGGRPDSDSSEQRLYVALKQIAGDVRGALPYRRSHAVAALGARIDAAKRSGYMTGHMVGLAQEVLGCWSTVRQALEQFEASVTTNMEQDCHERPD